MKPRIVVVMDVVVMRRAVKVKQRMPHFLALGRPHAQPRMGQRLPAHAENEEDGKPTTHSLLV